MPSTSSKEIAGNESLFLSSDESAFEASNNNASSSLVDERTAADVGGVGSIPPSSRRRDLIPPLLVDEAWHSYIIYNIYDWV